jgi:Fe-S cluster assembly protein SufD
MTMTPAPVFQPDFSAQVRSSPMLEALGAEARRYFMDRGFPSRRDEDWRLTSLASVIETPFSPAEETTADTNPWVLPDAISLIFINGRLTDNGDNTNLPRGVTVTSLGSATGADADLIDQHLGQLASIDNRPFVALNTAQSLEGTLIHLAPNTLLDRPINIVNVTTVDNGVAYPRTLIVADAGSRATVVETFIGEGTTLCCPVTEVSVGPGATVGHIRLIESDPESSILGTIATSVAEGASFRLSSASIGGALSRTDILVDLEGEGADASLDGLTLVGGNDQGVTEVRVNHRVPNCTSSQRFRSVLDERSRAVFTGRSVVAEDAQKTDARQSSRSLLRSLDAVAHNNPQLEIYADDVRCTHGSTVGRLDEEALFYLRARGIDRQTARGLLTLAFAAEVLEGISIDSLKERLEDLLMARLGPEGLR